jgi:undecaprenyl-diphosphatase
MRRAELEALALGLLHGPAELVPVSSSGHVAGVPWLLGWEVSRWDGARRKELEVALHGGSALALLLVARPERVRPLLLVAAFIPPAVAGLTLERRIEQRLGTPGTLAAGLLAGGAALVLADRCQATRRAADARIADGLALGLAQAAALVPGVSRNGATLAAGRARGFGRADASRLSWEVALPVLLGANALKAVRVAQAGAVAGSAGRVRPLALGAAAAFASTVATAGAIGVERRAPLWPWALWRAGLAGAILRVRQNRRDDA